MGQKTWRQVRFFVQSVFCLPQKILAFCPGILSIVWFVYFFNVSPLAGVMMPFENLVRANS